MHRKREKSDYIVHNVDLAFDILFYIARKQSVKTKDLEEKFNVFPYNLRKDIRNSRYQRILRF